LGRQHPGEVIVVFENSKNYIKAFLRDAVVKRWRLNGRSIEYHSGASEVASLIQAMHPVKTRFELIRIGGNADGGYLIPDDIEGLEAVFSPGVSDVANFEAEMASRGIQCFLADASVVGPPIMNDRFSFVSKHIGLIDDGMFITMDKWVADNAPGTGDLLLQMDIEGSEWGALANISEATLGRFRIIVLELHELGRLFYFQLYRQVLTRLLLTYHVVHLHANNAGSILNFGDFQIPELLEVTFLRKDRSECLDKVWQLPHPLDKDNVRGLPSIRLPRCWYDDSSM
jgi:hypothetical protein